MSTYEERQYARQSKLYGKKLMVYRPRVNDVRMEFEIRFDPTKGLFASFVGHEWLTANVLQELQATIREKAEDLNKITWGFFIEFDEVVDKDDGNHSYYGGRRERIHIEANWHVVEISNQLPGGKYLHRRAWMDEGEEVPRSSGYRPDEIEASNLGTHVPFTKERWERLQELKEAANKVGARLKEMLDTNNVAGFLDAGIPLLLPSSVTGRIEDNAVREDPGNHKAGRRRRG